MKIKLIFHVLMYIKNRNYDKIIKKTVAVNSLKLFAYEKNESIYWIDELMREKMVLIIFNKLFHSENYRRIVELG